MTDEQQPIVRDPRKPANMLTDVSQVADNEHSGSSNDSSNGSSDSPLNASIAGSSRVDASVVDLHMPVRKPTLSKPTSGKPTDAPTTQPATDLPSDDVERGLARLDPLTVRPRTSARILCIVFGVLLLAFAAGVWWLGVRTESGQAYDEIVVLDFRSALPAWLGAMVSPFINSALFPWLPGGSTDLAVIVSVLFGVAALVVMIVRKRWWLIGQSVVFAVLCYAASWLKAILPRPFIINTDTPHTNSAPSGHTILAMTAVVVLLIAVPRVWRAVCALIAAVYGVSVGLSVIAGGWHRPSDVVMAILLVGGIALLTLAVTRASGMDEPGERVSSTSIQIVGTVMITAGAIACLYAAYVIWQIAPGLQLSAQWTQSGAHLSTVAGVTGAALLVGGLILMMRQLTASPLTRIGLIGAPPAPPRPRD